jgi:hypothetical protein
VVELVDTLDSKSSAARCEGSTPSSGTCPNALTPKTSAAAHPEHDDKLLLLGDRLMAGQWVLVP